MKKFLQLHFLTAYGPSNLNRDDLGRPKTVMMGGKQRLRVSSQCLKRAWRTSEIFESALKGHIGTRTRAMAAEFHQQLVQGGVKEKLAKDAAESVAKAFGKLDKEFHIAQIAHVAPEEQTALNALAAKVIATGEAPSEADLQLLNAGTKAADIALFGRMFADSPESNSEAACQVAHAFSVSAVQLEPDFFTAVDDLKQRAQESGSGHMGETEFGAAVYYNYLCIDRELLKKNLQDDAALTKATLQALVEAALTVSPSGKQNSFASRAKAHFALAERGDGQPRSLSLAFLDLQRQRQQSAHDLLVEQQQRFIKGYGEQIEDYRLCLESGQGNLAGLLAFVQE